MATVTAGDATQRPRVTEGHHRRLPAWALAAARALAAAGGGALLYASFPPRPLWWLAPLAFAVLGVVLHGRRARTGFGLGYLFGLGFLLPLLHWTGVYVGATPWLALVAVEALFLAAVGAAVAVASRLPGAPLWAACLWVAGEAARARVPFGGLPWGRVAFGQPDGVFLPLAALGGSALLSFAVVLCGFGLGGLGIRALATRLPTRQAARWPTAVAAAVVPVLAALAASPLLDDGSGGATVTVAAVQGNVPRAGLDFNAQRRAVLDNHVARTEQLVADVRSGRVARPDLVIWPENSSDVDPFRNPDAYAEITRVVDDLGVPVLVGAVLVNDDGTTTNSALVWQPGIGPVGRYDKRVLLPFGEYLPWRGIFSKLNPYAHRAGYFVPGHGRPVVDMAGLTVGVATCWEVAFDAAVEDSVEAGAELLAVPTNNATFGRTQMTYQQLAMSRVRAVEHDRAVVVAATSGVSAIVRPDGTVAAQTALFTPAALVQRVGLRTDTTLATRLGALPEWVLTAIGLTALGAALVVSRRARSGAGPGPRP